LAPVATGTPPTTDRRDPFRWLAGIITLLAVGLAVRHPWSADLGIHVATVERLRTSFAHPGNPLVEADTPSAYYSPYTLLLAAVARVTGLSALTVLWIAGPVVVAVLLWGLRAFVRALMVKEPPQRLRRGGMAPVLYMSSTKLLVGALGMGLAFAPSTLYSFYSDQARVWGLSASDDQALAGILMAVEQSVVMGLALVVLFIVMATVLPILEAGNAIS